MNPHFISIDIETLGLSLNAPIIEFGAVIANWQTKTILGEFHTYVVHDSYDNCEPYAMSMHPEILRRIGNNDPNYWYTHISTLGLDFHCALKPWYSLLLKKGKYLIAGKNVASFDIPRLRHQCPTWDQYIPCHSRTLDPGMLLWDPKRDDLPPGSNECLSRCGLTKTTQHTALEDARDVAEMIIKLVGSL